MKKILLGTSAIVLAGAIASPAAAAEWSMRVHGYMEQHLGYANTDDNDTTDGDYDGIDLKEDSEIWFSPSITLDNGIKFSARIELEGRTQGDQIDETYMNISGSFGTIRLGEDDQVSYNISTTAPDVTSLNINSGSDTKFFGGTLLTAFTTTLPAVAADPAGISYYSPSLAGFQIGASYARDGLRATTQSQQDQDMQPSTVYDTWAVAASYDNTFGDASVRISGGYATGSDADGDDIDSWGAGINVGFGGFTVGGSYANWDADHDFDGGHYHGYDNDTWDVGVSYETGPWGFSFTYINSDQKGWDDEVEGFDLAGDVDIDKFLLGISYKLAQGVKLSAWGVYADAEWDGTATDDGENFESVKFDEDAIAIGTSIRLDF